jgi:hypothetical protein
VKGDDEDASASGRCLELQVQAARLTVAWATEREAKQRSVRCKEEGRKLHTFNACVDSVC